MAKAIAENLGNSFQGMAGLPLLRQFGLLIGLAATIALGVAVALWSQESGYTVLYGGLEQRDAMAVVDSLQGARIPYRLDQNSGAIMVRPGDVHGARLHLAGQGLPQGGNQGFEMLEKDQGFGTSRFMENARFQRALEGELARTIATIASVNSARVHLALPKQTVFVRERSEPTASVVVNLYAGRTLEPHQVDAIVNLVAGSVPELSAGSVKVIDQRGRLLSSGQRSDLMGMTNDQFDYVRRMENSYVKRIEQILVPVMGADGVRAQVTAEVDFTVSESTSERFNPDLPALRSEQTSEELSLGASGAEGVPGALTNSPPEGGTLVEGQALSDGTPGSGPKNSTRRATRNYELDKTISHTRVSAGRLQRLSVAVVVNHKPGVDDAGVATRTPLTDEELARLTTLVREAVGYSEQRGDTVNVVNVPFAGNDVVAEPVPEPAIWEQPWVMDIGMKLLGAILVLFIIFGVIRPVMKSLAEKAPVSEALPSPQEYEAQMVGPDGQPLHLPGGQVGRLSGPGAYELQLKTAQEMAQQDPKRVAQVVKTWITSDS